MKTVPTVGLADTTDAAVLPDLPEEVGLALTDIAGAAREGLMAMSVAAGMAVMAAMFEAEMAEACGPKGKHNRGRAAVRHGIGKGSVALGGRRVPVDRPRARTLDGHEVPLISYGHFAADDLLTQVVMERMLAGVATRRHARTAEPVGTQVDREAKSTSRSAISRRFVRQTETALAELMARDLAGEDIKVLMLDGEHMAERCVVVALAITADGTKKPVGLWEGSTENKTVVRSLLADLVERGLTFDDGLLVVIDGAKALSAAVREVFGAKAAIQRCTLHKRIMSLTTCRTRTRTGCTPSWSRRSATPTLSKGCATLKALPRNWISATRARPRRCAKGWRRCSPSPGSASTAAWPRPSPPATPSSR
jgi:putative transposase